MFHVDKIKSTYAPFILDYDKISVPSGEKGGLLKHCPLLHLSILTVESKYGEKTFIIGSANKTRWVPWD
jgi:hypothetical protein